MREKKTLVALALSAVLPSLTHTALRLEYSIGSGSYPLSGRRSGVGAENIQSEVAAAGKPAG